MNHSKALNRRTFLRKSAALASSITAFPTLIPASALGKNGHIAPSNRITTAIIGLGKLGRGFHLNTTLGNPEFQLIGLADVNTACLKYSEEKTNKEYRNKYSENEYKSVSTFSNFLEMLEMPGLDSVQIATQDHWHAIQAIEACRRKIDVYCQKPLAMTIEEGRAIVDAAEKYGIVFQVGSQQRSDASFRLAAERIYNGHLGKLKEVWVDIGGGPANTYNFVEEPVPDCLDWDAWVGPAPYRPYSSKLAAGTNLTHPFLAWRYVWDYGGGKMTDFGAHHLDIAHWAMGLDATGPKRIEPKGHNGNKDVVFHYEGHAPIKVGTTDLRLTNSSNRQVTAAIEFVGERGRLAVNRSNALFADDPALLSKAFSPSDKRLYNSSSHMQNWIDCIKSRGKTICPANVGHNTIAACHIGNIVRRLNRPVTWDHKTESFIDDPQANRMRSRPLRGPWSLIV